MITEVIQNIIINWILLFAVGFGLTYFVQAILYRTWNFKKFDYQYSNIALLTVWGFISLTLGIIFHYV